MFEKLIDLSIDKWRSTFFIIFLLFIFGITSYVKIPKEENPEIEIPYILIDVSYQGVAPEDGERMIIKPLERQLKTISGIKKINCTANFGSVSCGAEFKVGKVSVKQALTDVRDRVSIAKAEFPSEAKEPFVREYDMNKESPVLSLQIKGNVSDDILFKIAEDLKEGITSLKEVLDVETFGKRDHSVEVIISPEVIAQYKINMGDLKKVGDQNVIIIGGTVRNGDGEFKVKIPGLIQNLNDLLEMPIKIEAGKITRLKDVASVTKSYKDRFSHARLNGEKIVRLNTFKRSGENVIFTVLKIKAVVDYYKQFMPKDVEIIYTNDKSKQINDSLTNLNNNLILAVIIVFFVALNLIGLRESLFVMSTIPLTFLMGILFLYLGGYTMNVVVLFALVLGTGMIVDASIVIIDYAELLLKDGVSHKDAFRRAAKRMFIPVFSAVITVLIASGPLLFWPGVAGQFMKYLPLTLIALLASSFVAAIFFLPTIATKFGKSHVQNEDEESVLQYSNLVKAPVSEVLKIKGAIGGYANILWKFLQFPKLTLAFLGIFLIIVGTLYGFFQKGMEFFPNVETDFASVRVYAKGNLSLAEKNKLMLEIEKRIFEIQDIKYFNVIAQTRNDDQIGRINLEFQAWDKRRKLLTIFSEIKEKLKPIPGIEIKTATQKSGPGGTTAIGLNITGRDFSEINDTLDKVKKYMIETGKFIDIEDTSVSNKIQYSIKVNRAEAVRYGIDIRVLGGFIALATDGLIISDYRPSYSEDKVDIVVRFPPKYRNIEEIKNINIPSTNGEFVPISSFAKIKEEREVASITRIDQKQVVELKANVADAEKTALYRDELYKWINENAQNFAGAVKIAGEKEDMEETQAFLGAAFLTSIVMMLLLFLMQFNSLGKSLIVLSSIFLSFFGVLISLLITGQPFGLVMCGIAIISLAGIVVDSNILFIETFKDLEEKLEIKEALLKTAIIRLKPILLASVTTIAGLIPMAFGVSINFIEQDLTIGSPSSAFWKQLASSIVGGLSFVVLLTLFITPSIIYLEETLKKKFKNDGGFKIFNLFKGKLQKNVNKIKFNLPR
jgi:multidrug efflux pump